jgi:hypothetical protein
MSSDTDWARMAASVITFGTKPRGGAAAAVPLHCTCGARPLPERQYTNGAPQHSTALHRRVTSATDCHCEELSAVRERDAPQGVGGAARTPAQRSAAQPPGKWRPQPMFAVVAAAMCSHSPTEPARRWAGALACRRGAQPSPCGGLHPRRIVRRRTNCVRRKRRCCARQQTTWQRCAASARCPGRAACTGRTARAHHC